MSQLAPLQLDDGTFIYIEASEDQVEKTPHLVPVDPFATEISELESRRVGKGWRNSARVLQGAGGLIPKAQRHQFQAVQKTIQGYTRHTLSALSASNFATSNLTHVERVTLEFGIQLSGAMGVPYITRGAAESNVKVTVQCSFPVA